MALLDVDNLTMRFGGLTAVKDVSFDVEPDKIVSLIGPNGAGKTTVFNAITGVYDPTEGHVLFAGHRLRRPVTGRIVLGCLAVGLFTALVAALLSINVNKLWLAVVKRTPTAGQYDFSLATMRRDAQDYLFARLAIARERGNRWQIVSADGVKVIDTIRAKGGADEQLAAAYEEAEQRRDDWQELVAQFRPLSSGWHGPVERGRGFAIMSADGQRVLATFPRKEMADNRLEDLREIEHDSRKTPITFALAFLIGLTVGSAGTFAVWNRSRRTPDVIATGGIARTFQNIRLFANMSVLENVLVALDRRYRRGMLATILRTPGFRRAREAACQAAVEQLAFVGLADKRTLRANQLAYGDQRRLEIARALATQPKLLLLDEPAAGMNPAESAELMTLVRRIRDRGVTVLLIEHHMKVVMGISDRIAVLDYGVKIAEGTPEEVRANPKVIEAYLGKEELG